MNSIFSTSPSPLQQKKTNKKEKKEVKKLIHIFCLDMSSSLVWLWIFEVVFWLCCFKALSACGSHRVQQKQEITQPEPQASAGQEPPCEKQRQLPVKQQLFLFSVLLTPLHLPQTTPNLHFRCGSHFDDG